MDNFKKATVKDYTAWDLNTEYVKNRKIKQKFNKKGRKKLKNDIRTTIEQLEKYEQ